jgi:hypothetical protein
LRKYGNTRLFSILCAYLVHLKSHVLIFWLRFLMK